jgi:hypothetical protein
MLDPAVNAVLKRFSKPRKKTRCRLLDKFCQTENGEPQVLNTKDVASDCRINCSGSKESIIHFAEARDSDETIE